jgi:hypothetical protein
VTKTVPVPVLMKWTIDLYCNKVDVVIFLHEVDSGLLSGRTVRKPGVRSIREGCRLFEAIKANSRMFGDFTAPIYPRTTSPFCTVGWDSSRRQILRMYHQSKTGYQRGFRQNRQLRCRNESTESYGARSEWLKRAHEKRTKDTDKFLVT